MLLSNILKGKCNFKILDEQEVVTLGNIESKISVPFLSFIDDEKYIEKIIKNEYIKMVMATEELAYKLPSNIGKCICDNPRVAFYKLHNQLSENKEYVNSKSKNIIGENCIISKLCYIEEHDVIIGDNVIIEEFVSIKAGTKIGKNTIIRAGCVIGNSGFEFKKEGNSIFAVKHYGTVVIGENVEIKCNAVIDRAIFPWDSTKIGDYCKIDYLSSFSHACKVADRVLVAANTAVGGRVEIGSNTWLGIGCSIRNGIRIGHNARCNMGSVVTKDVEDNESVSGNFAINHKIFIENLKNE